MEVIYDEGVNVREIEEMKKELIEYAGEEASEISEYLS
jgi:hypothetical protein